MENTNAQGGHLHFCAVLAFFPHRAAAARCADFFRCAGLSLALSVAAPFRPPRRPIARMTWEMVAWSGAGSSWVLCRTMEAANWLMSWDSLRVRLGMCPVSQVGRRRQACGNSKDPTTNLCIPASSPGDAVSYRPLPGPYEECRRDLHAILMPHPAQSDRKSTRLNSSHRCISY